MCEGVIGAARDWSETSVMRVGGPFSPQSMKVSGMLSNDWVNTSKSSFNRPLSFISLSHSDNQSQSTTKFYNSSKVDAGGHVLTLTSCVLRFDRAESFWMPTDIVKFPVHSVRLLKKKLRHLAGRCYY